MVIYRPRTDRGGKETSNLIAEHFNSTFSNNATSLTGSLDYTTPSVAADESNLCLPFCEDVSHVIRNLDTSKGAGLDSLLPSFWTLILNNSLSQGVFHRAWKCAFVVAIHNSGLRSKVVKYRQMSLLSCPAKIGDKMMCQRMTSLFSTFISLVY